MEREIRVVGKPQGAEILYIEDYVFSFVRAVLLERRLPYVQAIIFGDEKKDNQRHYYYVSGVAFEEEEKVYFEGEKMLGQAHVTLSADAYPEILLKFQKDDCREFKDYYIYYADNENMKKYILSFAGGSTAEKNITEGKYCTVNATEHSFLRGVGEIVRYVAVVLALAYIIISMNHYRKLELVSRQAVYVIKTISQEDIFYTP